MAKISKIEAQKKRKNRYNIFVDDKFEVGVFEKDLMEMGIVKDKEITKKELKKIKEKSNEGKAKDKALRLLSLRPRSIKELEDKLLKKGYDYKVVKKIMSWLKKERYLDDKGFAKSWVLNRKKFHPLGKRRLSLELKKKQVPEEIIEREISRVSQRQEVIQAKDLAKRRIKIYKNEDKYKKREKIIAFLQRRGYNWDVIKEAIEKINF